MDRMLLWLILAAIVVLGTLQVYTVNIQTEVIRQGLTRTEVELTSRASRVQTMIKLVEEINVRLTVIEKRLNEGPLGGR